MPCFSVDGLIEEEKDQRDPDHRTQRGGEIYHGGGEAGKHEGQAGYYCGGGPIAEFPGQQIHEEAGQKDMEDQEVVEGPVKREDIIYCAYRIEHACLKRSELGKAAEYIGVPEGDYA